MCGLVGIVAGKNVAPDIYDALTVLQHRGQDAAGIMTCDRGRFSLRKSEGLVRDVFRQQHMQRLEGNVYLYPEWGTQCVHVMGGMAADGSYDPMVYVNNTCVARSAGIYSSCGDISSQ